MSIPPDFLDDLRTRVPVSDVVRRRVQLRKQGREWAGLSPFNKEKTPSFFVNDDKRFYHCFSSGKHGDVFSFLMEVEGLTFREAVETVAALAGMDVPSEGPEMEQRRRVAKTAMDTLAIATEFYESQLRMPAGRGALAYLKDRGLDDATIRRFRLGYAPSAYGSLAASLTPDGISQDQLVEAGLMKRRDDGRVTDYFRDRIMFPITDRQGHVIAFGGRTLGDAQPKYLNSPENAVFHKGSVLYGLASARQAAHQSDRVLVVEGYMDVIALAQAGIAEAVAPLGTAIGEDQIRLLWTLAAEPVLCLDGDRAGRAAAIRAAERALPGLKPGKSLRFALLPEGEDPDTLVRRRGTEAVEAIVAAATPLADVLWQAEAERNPPTSPERRAAFHRALLAQVQRIADETVRAYYEQDMRQRLRAAFTPAAPPADATAGHRNRRRPWTGEPTRRLRPNRRPNPGDLAHQRERVLLGLLVLHPVLAEEVAERFAAIPLRDNALDSLRNRILSVLVTHNDLDAGRFMTQLMEGVASAPDMTALISSMIVSAQTAIPAVRNSDAVALEEARTAVADLLKSIESDGVSADLRQQAAILDDEFGAYDRLTRLVAAERQRLADGQG
ncbi:MAG: DNA primase [Alphaproteobacteria bacterium]|nr:DNA primase [Alphaproteobacteria bacterium]MCB9929994.1 DNA primase [Alphaproteobacteria bacterium]